MGTTVSNIPTTENTYKPQAAQGGQETSAPNSVYDVQQPASNETNNQTQTSKVDEILQKICEKFKKYGITAEDLKKLSLIQKLAQYIDKIPENELEDTIKECTASIEAAIRDSVGKDGKIDFDKANKLSIDYRTAIATGWTIEGFKKWNATHEKDSLFERLKEVGCLPSDATKENTSPETIKAAIKKFCDGLLGKALNDPNPDPKKVLTQLQTFGRLLINSPEDEKELFLEVAKQLHSENKYTGLKELIENCKEERTRQVIAAGMGSPEYLKEITTTPDAAGNVVSEDDATAISALAASYQSEEDRVKNHEDYNTARAQWFEQNKEALEAIDQKIKKAEADGVEPEFTDEEKQLLIERKNFIIAVSAGEFIGTHANEFLSEEFKTAHMSQLNEDAYEIPDYKEILQQVDDYTEKHPEAIPGGKEAFTRAMDKATNGNYTTVASGSDAELKSPVSQNKSGKTDTTPDLGFSQRESVDPSRLQTLRQQIASTGSQTEGYRVEKTVTSPIQNANT